MMQVKVCGMRQSDNIEAMLALPIDMIGFIFYPESKRFVGEQDELAQWVRENEETFNLVKKVGVFVNAGTSDVLNAIHDYELDFVQLHGSEAPGYCRELELLWTASSIRTAKLVKAFSIDEKFDFAVTTPFEDHCSFFVFDTKGVGFGGTGKQFDWSLLEKYEGSTPFLLSGGIGGDSAEAILELDHPMLFGVDINSKFEIEPGLKDVEMTGRFVQKLKQHQQ
ncbi:MAG TPA: phosphoribosylanthranilate isomerase [Saprospiraceae bacterium]|nr:phosphoribosylanthranilate isomerase [Saprospiraceae bacterium]